MFYSESFHEPQELSASSYRSYEIQFTATDMVRTGIRNEFFCKSSASDRQIRWLSPPSAEGAAGVVHAKYFTVLSSRYAAAELPPSTCSSADYTADPNTLPW